MSLLSRLESKFGRYAVPNLTVVLIVGQVSVYIANEIQKAQGHDGVIQRLWLWPEKVMQGEVWRLVTYLFDPPLTNPIFAFFFWYLFYLMGTTLEATWGALRYNLFLAIGYFASIAFAFLVMFVLGKQGEAAPNGFLCGTVFLAFARLNPDFVLHIFFILPVKMRWLALFAWIGYAWSFITGDWVTRMMVVAAVLNFLLFFGRDIWRDMKQGRRQMRHQARTIQSPSHIVHECKTCGLTSEMEPKMQFRYCSQCTGQNCYCEAHLRKHEHVVQETV